MISGKNKIKHHLIVILIGLSGIILFVNFMWIEPKSNLVNESDFSNTQMRNPYKIQAKIDRSRHGDNSFIYY